MSRRILILGGTGVFGSRLARHLARHPDGLAGAELIVTSRDGARAARLAAELHGRDGARVVGMAVDTREGWPAALEAAMPWAVVDCSGPFQDAGHTVAEAALRSSAHVIDLADARDYLAGHAAALDGAARAAGRVALAGASSTPALSGAVARRLTDGWSRVETIDVAIVPGGRSEVGPAVLAAVLGYAGRPVPVWRDGRLVFTPGWIGAGRVELPGLGARRVAPVETMDAERLGPSLRVTDRVSFRAGLESMPEQLGLEVLARLRRRGLVGDPRRLAGPLRALRRITRLTTGDEGGMIVAATGRRAGPDGRESPWGATWTLLARRGDGPQVPTLAAAAALRALARGELAPGARLADEVLALDAIEAEMTPHAIETRIRSGPLRDSS